MRLPSGVHWAVPALYTSGSETRCSLPPSAGMTYACESSVASALVYEIHLPSGDHCGLVTAEPPKLITSPLAMAVVWPFSKLYLYSFLSLAVYNRCLESGDQMSWLFVV